VASRAASLDDRSTTILEAAIAMADAEGADVVTLRSIAVRTGLPQATVHRDFSSRDRLVASMAQRIFSSHMRPPAQTGDAVATLCRLAEQEWGAYGTHPWLVSVMASTRPPLVPAVLDAARATIEVFLDLGLDDEAALNRYLALNAYIQGMGLLLIAEHRESARSGSNYHAWWSEEIRRLDRSGSTLRHPWISELAEQPRADGFDAHACFRANLHRVVSGLVGSGPE
jgi:AcrR family transcriptional regulator